MQNLMISIKIIVWCSKYLIVLANGTKYLPYKLFLNNWEQFAKWADFPRIRASSFITSPLKKRKGYLPSFSISTLN